MDFLEILNKELNNKTIPPKIFFIFNYMYLSYKNTVESYGQSIDKYKNIFHLYLKLVKNELASPHDFQPFHRKITEPFNFQEFGLELFLPIVDQEASKVLYRENVAKMAAQIKKGENVIMFANHQTEIDPQLIMIALDHDFREFARDMIFVAGDRVITDPLAIPLSMGCNLLCIYSKRHIDNPPEKKHEKQQHNQRTMRLMKELLHEGGKCIYVAPSGGRDRPNKEGEVVLAPFDPQSIEMFRLMAKQARTTTHFYPLALLTYNILPPPDVVQTELGEERHFAREGAHFAFGDEIDIEHFPGYDLKDRHARRSAQALHIWNLVKTHYHELKHAANPPSSPD